MKHTKKIINNIIGKGKVFGGKNDWDGDGITNKKDCQPRNTMRQDSGKCPHCGRFLKTHMGDYASGAWYSYCTNSDCPYLKKTGNRYQEGYSGGKRVY